MPAEASPKNVPSVHNPKHALGSDSLHRLGKASLQVLQDLPIRIDFSSVPFMQIA
jgi:hypothetical protein